MLEFEGKKQRYFFNGIEAQKIVENPSESGMFAAFIGEAVVIFDSYGVIAVEDAEGFYW